jgi:hypothetical protein
MFDRRRLPLTLGAILLIIAACGGRGPEPPRPSRTLEATVVGVVTAVDTGRSPYVVSLASGQQISLSSLGGTAAVSRWGNLDRGFLWLSDSLTEPAWYAWAPPNGTIWSGQRELDPTCWELRGGAYEDDGFVHFSAGLRLKKSADFRIAQTYIKDPWPARAGDVFCVTSTGEVKSLISIFLPY